MTHLRLVNVQIEADFSHQTIAAVQDANQLYCDPYGLQREHNAPPPSDDVDVPDAAAIRRAARFVAGQSHHQAVQDLLSLVSPVLYMALGQNVIQWDRGRHRVWVPGLPDALTIRTDTGEQREDHENWLSSSGLVAVRFAQMSRFRMHDHLVIGIYHMSEAELKQACPRE